MTKFIVETRFIFEGTFEVEAESKEQAEQVVLCDTGLAMGQGIHSVGNNVRDWNFSIHPEKYVDRVKEIE